MVDVLDSNEIATGVVALFGVAQGINLWRTRKIDKSTQQINNAVNHVQPGAPTLTERVDSLAKDIEWIRAVNLVTKTEVEKRFNEADTKHDTLRGMVEEIKDTQNKVAEDVASLREAVDRRKA